MRYLRSTTAVPKEPCIAHVTYSGDSGFGAVSSTEERGLPVFAPRGICYRPCEGDSLLLVPVEGGETCAGVLTNATGLKDGELRLTSSGGATILLQSNGDVVINGLVISKEGRIVEGR